VAAPPEPGDGWVYEHILTVLPWTTLPARRAIALQFVGFEALVLALAWNIGRPGAAVAGSAAVLVATVGSVAMVAIGRTVREADASAAYRRLLFGTNIEVVLGVAAFAALATALVLGVAGPEPGLLERLLGTELSAPAVFIAFVLAWDVCYRIGVGWWASLVGCWRSLTGEYDRETAAAYRRADLTTIGFASVQLVLVPVVASEPLLAVAVLGHVAAVWAVSGTSIAALGRRQNQSS
jgi:hypothetical protein